MYGRPQILLQSWSKVSFPFTIPYIIAASSQAIYAIIPGWSLKPSRCCKCNTLRPQRNLLLTVAPSYYTRGICALLCPAILILFPAIILTTSFPALLLGTDRGEERGRFFCCSSLIYLGKVSGRNFVPLLDILCLFSLLPYFPGEYQGTITFFTPRLKCWR